jgi:hypothetical protein
MIDTLSQGDLFPLVLESGLLWLVSIALGLAINASDIF